MGHKPRLLDLYCKAGGTSRGYQMAGFHVTGVDIEPQAKYIGDEFVRGDAIEYLLQHGHKYDAIAASPPCQAYSSLRHLHDKEYPDLVAATREALQEVGKPYVIENVEGAPLHEPVLLCGTMFGLKVFRHRLFECSFFLLAPPHTPHRHYGKAGKQGRVPLPHEYITVTGHFGGVAFAQTAMGIDWMGQAELSQAIPPAYTKFIGDALIEIVGGQDGTQTSAYTSRPAWQG